MENSSTALSNVAKLSPEIRLAQAISEFGVLFADDGVKHAQFKNLRNRSPPTAGEVVQLTEEVNRDGSRRHKSWKPFATRLVLVLERVQQFAPIGDVLTGGAQSMLASGVWASIRMALEISLGFLSYFDKVSNLLLRIGRCVSLHQDFALLFPRCSQIQSFMCEYTIVIVQICKEIVVYARKPFANQLASSFLSPFDTVFKPLEDQLLGWGRLIEKRTQIMATKSSLERESTSVERYNRLQVLFTKQAYESRSRDRESLKHRFLKDLSPDQREFDSIWRRERRRGTSQWILKHPQYKEWLESSDAALLWLQGNLGSGKTVTMASVVASLVTPDSKSNSANAANQKHEALRTVSSFFCTKTADKTLKRRNIIGSLTCQALRHETIIPSLVKYLGKKPEAIDTLDSMDYVDLLLAITPRDWQGVFILDGLDEVPLDETKDLFVDFQRLLKSRNVLLCCSARSNSICKATVEAMVPVKSTISMEAEDRLADFEAYISTEIEHWKLIRPLSSEIEQLIIKQLLVGCQGMFLWLALQMEAICSRHTQELRSDSSILRILDNLPRNLPEAFDQALLRISDVRNGSRALQLVSVADPPLSSDELRVAVNVEPGNLAWTSSTIIGPGTSLGFHYGGSLLETDEEDLCVRLIHHSVFLHLINPPALPAAAAFHFDLSDAEVDLAATCVTYLSYGIFENQLSKTQNIAFGNVPDRVQDSLLQPYTITRKALSILSRSGRRTHSANINIERLLHELRSYESKAGDEVYLFLPYATKHWLDLTKSLPNPLPPAVHALWTRLVDGSTGSTLESIPWTPRSIASATTWAIFNQHKYLLRHQLCNPCESQMIEAAEATMSVLRYPRERKAAHVSIRPSGEDLGNLAPTYLRIEYATNNLGVRDVIDLVNTGCLPWANGSSYDLFKDPISAEADLDTIAKGMIPKILRPPPGLFYVHSTEATRSVVFLAHYLKDINQLLANGLTLLEELITSGRRETARALLEELKADPNGPRRQGTPSPLQLCLRQKDHDLATLLIDQGADVMDNPDENLLPPFLTMIEEQNMSLFHRAKARFSEHKDRKYGKEKDTAFQFACKVHRELGLSRANSFIILTYLLENGADIDSLNGQGQTPLVSSIVLRESTLTDWLLEAGADPNEARQGAILPLYVATGEGVQKLLKAGAYADPSDAHGITPLMVAAFSADRLAVEALIGAGASVQSRIHGNRWSAHEAWAILLRFYTFKDVDGAKRVRGPAILVELGDTAPMLVIRHLEFLQRGEDFQSREPIIADSLTILSMLSRVASGELNKELREYVQRYEGTDFGVSLMQALGEE